MTSRRAEDAARIIAQLARRVEALERLKSRIGHGHVLGYAQVIVDQTGISTLVDLTGLSVTVDVGTGRRIKITGYAHFISVSSADEKARLRIRDGANNTLNFANSSELTGQAEDQGQDLACIAVVTPTSGSQTYKLSAERIQGTTDIEMDASSIHPAFVLVEDIGPA